MSIEQLEKNIEAQFEKNGPHDPEALFNLFIQTEADALKDYGAKEAELERVSDQLGDYQDTLVGLSSQIAASSMEDVLFKMALWRRYAPQIDPLDTDMTGDEILAYSIFRDVAVMCKREDVFTPHDKEYMLDH